MDKNYKITKQLLKLRPDNETVVLGLMSLGHVAHTLRFDGEWILGAHSVPKGIMLGLEKANKILVTQYGTKDMATITPKGTAALMDMLSTLDGVLTLLLKDVDKTIATIDETIKHVEELRANVPVSS